MSLSFPLGSLLIFFLNPGFCGAGLLYIGYMVGSTLWILFGDDCPLGCGGRGIQDITAEDGTYSLSLPS